jgi:hypothetical protein
VQAAPADDVGHERVAGREPAAGESKRERPQVHAVARAAASLGKVTLQDHAQTTLELLLGSAGPVGQPQPPRELTQELDQWQIGPRGRFDPVRRGLGDGDCFAAMAALSAGSSSRKPGLRLTMPLRWFWSR